MLAQKLLLSSLLNLMLYGVFAQSTHFEFGINAGAGVTSLHDKSYTRYFDWEYKTTSGFQVAYRWNDALSVHANIGYETKGCKGANLKIYSKNGEDLGSKNNFNLNYQFLTIPLLFRYTGSGHSPFFINAGPYVGYVLSYKEVLGITTIDRTQDMKQIDFGVSLGLGFIFPIGDRWNISMELRNNTGLQDLYKSTEAYQTSPVKPAYVLGTTKTNSTNFMIGVNFKL